jgi:hypothetical protein
MNLRERVESFAELGTLLDSSIDGRSARYSRQLEELIGSCGIRNPWFTPPNVRMAIQGISGELTFDNLCRWTGSYPLLGNEAPALKAGVIMAGNIPLAGFHDFLSVLISGNSIIAKTSSRDNDLLPFISNMLSDINPGFRNMVVFTGGIISGFDAVIASGGNNTSRYFESYFSRYPSIIRRNRNSVAVIRGDETEAELRALGIDVFSYFGLGCRNVSKLFVPPGYDFQPMMTAWEEYSEIIFHSKYANNYEYNKAVYLVNKESFIDTGFVILKEDSGLSSPTAVLYYEYLDSPGQLTGIRNHLKDTIQCIVGKDFIPFGKAQKPALWEYADSVDTIEFLLKIYRDLIS